MSQWAVRCDGGASDCDAIDFGSQASIDNLSTFTCEFWIKVESVGGTWNFWGRNGPLHEAWFMASPYRFPFYRIYIDGGTPSNSEASGDHQGGGGDIPLDTWYHVAMSYDDTGDRRAHLWVNGEHYQGDAVSGGSMHDDSGANLYLGIADVTQDGIEAVYDEFRLSDNVRYAYSNITPPTSRFVTDANTLILAHLNEGTGTSCSDVSGNNNNGTFVESPSWIESSPFPDIVTGQFMSMRTKFW